jgi:hypothetical protein
MDDEEIEVSILAFPANKERTIVIDPPLTDDEFRVMREVSHAQLERSADGTITVRPREAYQVAHIWPRT